MLEPMAVAVHAIRKIRPSQMDKIAVCGLGTIGLCTLMFLQEMGCQDIYAAGNKDFQREMAGNIGLKDENFCDIRHEDFPKWLMDKTNGLGVDVFFDCVGKNEVLIQGIKSLGAGGKMMLVGNPASDIAMEKSLYWKILRSQLQLAGTWNSSFSHDKTDDWNYVLGCLERKSVKPERIITHRMGLEKFMEGFQIMRNKSEDYVKIMMVWDGCHTP